MNTRTASAALVAGLALGTAWLRPQAEPETPQNVGAQTGASTTSGGSDPVPRDAGGPEVEEHPTGQYLLQRYLHSEVNDQEFPVAGVTPGVMIVTVPDPIDSHMDWAFDTYLESVRRAYERAGYVLDRFWLPWSEKSDTTWAEVPGTRARRVREEYPGVLLFRSATARDTAPQLVYLVGEVPTAGVHKGALRRALDERDRLLPLARADSHDIVRIVGPSFSGSTVSLAQGIREWSTASPPRTAAAAAVPADSATSRSRASAAPAPRANAVRILSGAATLASNLAAFDSAHAGPRVFYRATVHSDDALTRTLLSSVVCRLGIHASQVLLLHESGTAYGNAAETGLRSSGGVQVRCAVAGSDSVLNSAAFLHIAFPMNIASLRAEYESHPRAAATKPDQQPQSRSRTRLTLRDPERPMDHLPVMSELTPPSLEVLVNQIEDAVSRHGVRAVGIVASDVRDKLFLAEEMRARLRDVTFFTFEGNSLFLVPDKNPFFHGMLVLSTYPLTLENQWWTGEGSQRHQLLPFANEGAQGIYNALLMQLDLGDGMAEYRAPFGADTLRTPPVWVSMVGSQSFLPLAFDRDSGQAAVLKRQPASLSFFTVLGLLLLAAGLVSAAARMLRRNDLVPRISKQIQGPALEDEVRWGSQLLHRHLYAFLRILALLSIFIPAAVLVYTAVSGATPVGPTIGMVAVALVSAILATLYFFITDLRTPALVQAPPVGPGSPRGPSAPGRWRVWAVGVVLLFTAGAALLLSAKISRGAYGVLVGVLLLAWVAGAAAGTWHALQAGRATWNMAPASWRYAGLPRLLFRPRSYAALRRLRRRLKAWPTAGDEGERVPRTEQLLWMSEVAGRVGVLVLGTGYFVVGMVFTVSLFKRFADASFPMLLDRLSRLDSGASPLLLIALSGVGFAAWCTWHLERIEQLRWSTAFEGGVWKLAAFPHPPTGLKEFTSLVAKVRSRLFLLMPNWTDTLFLLMLLVLAGLLYARVQPTVERMIGLRGFDLLLRLAVMGSLCTIVWAVYRLLAVWRALRRVLEKVGDTPLLPAFRRLPVRASQLTRLTLWASSGKDLVKSLSDAQWGQLVTIYRAGKLDAVKGGLEPRVRGWAKRLMKVGGSVHRMEGTLDDKYDERLLKLAEILWWMWRSEPDSDVLGKLPDALKDKEKTDTAAVFRDRFDSAHRLWLRAAEEFAAVQVVDYVEWVLQQMRTLALFIFVTLIVTTALISSYPFQPQGEVKLVFTLLLLGTVASLLYVMVAMNRDEVLSHIAATDPGRLNWSWSFALNIGAVALIPLLTLLSSEVPGLHSVLFSWAEPLVKALTHSG
ncbi:MAG TPA: hypothetical protein VGO40_05320 [Longimicrobium sp.]|jgi:hypothetical protein|nr:hypothetical protein [Longimicrobium sp.]